MSTKKYKKKLREYWSSFALPASSPRGGNEYPTTRMQQEWPYKSGRTIKNPKADAVNPGSPRSGDSRIQEERRRLRKEGVSFSTYNRPLGTGAGLGHSPGWADSIYPPWFEDRENIEDENREEYFKRWGTQDPLIGTIDALSPTTGRRTGTYKGYSGAPAMNGRMRLERALARAIENKLLEQIKAEREQSQQKLTPLEESIKDWLPTKAARQNRALQKTIEQVFKEQTRKDIDKIIETEVTTVLAGDKFESFYKNKEELESWQKTKNEQEQKWTKAWKEYEEYQQQLLDSRKKGEEPPKPSREIYANPNPEEVAAELRRDLGDPPDDVDERIGELSKIFDEAKKQLEAAQKKIQQDIKDIFLGADLKSVSIESFLRRLLDLFRNQRIPIRQFGDISAVTNALLGVKKDINKQERKALRNLLLEIISALYKDKHINSVVEDIAEGMQTRWFGRIEDELTTSPEDEEEGEAEVVAKKTAAGQQKQKEDEETKGSTGGEGEAGETARSGESEGEGSVPEDEKSKEEILKQPEIQQELQAAAIAYAKKVKQQPQAVYYDFHKKDPDVLRGMLEFIKTPTLHKLIEEWIAETEKEGGGRRSSGFRVGAAQPGPVVRNAVAHGRNSALTTILDNIIRGARDGEDGAKSIDDFERLFDLALRNMDTGYRDVLLRTFKRLLNKY